MITAAACEIPEAGGPRVHGTQPVRLTPGSHAARLYGATEVQEHFACSFELNPQYQPLFEASALRVTGTGERGEARVVELEGAPFFIATLYLPQMPALEGASHPLVEGFVRAAAGGG